MKTKILFSILLFSILISCSNDDVNSTNLQTSTNGVLMLKVDYTTNVFEGGKEFTFENSTSAMTITNEYITPGDFGNIKMIYQEINETLFDGSIIWMGLGQINFPQDVQAANQFAHVLTEDYITPPAGFENIFNLDNTTYDYNIMWSSVQSLVKVREYLTSNPNATVKVFLYTPSVGIGNPADWDWIIFMKN